MTIKWYQLDSRSLRLAASYLAIIMLLSTTFSAIFYHTSVSSLDTGAPSSSVAGSPTSTDTHSPAAPSHVSKDQGLSVNLQSSAAKDGTISASAGNATALSKQLGQQIHAIEVNLVHKLILLNLGALLVGGVLSYYLARRTMQPIEAALEAQSRFAADASHELRTPLTIMQSELEVVLKKSRLSTTRARAALQSNYHEVLRLKQLSDNLLHLARDEASDSNFVELSLDEVVNEAVNCMLKPAQAKQMSISDNVPAIRIRGELQALTQAIVILLDNAIKYSPAGTTITVSAETEGKVVRLYVRDQGPGIKAADIPHIFERFYRADSSRSAQQVQGHGLGLSIAQKIIHRHRGSLSVHSKPGHGTTFTIALPLL